MATETNIAQKNQGARKVLLDIEDLHVWFELRRFGFEIGRAHV